MKRLWFLLEWWNEMKQLMTPACTATWFLYQTSRVVAYLPGLHLRLRQNYEYHHNVQLLQQQTIPPQPRSKKLPRTSLLVQLPTRRFPTCSGKLTIELAGPPLMATPGGGQQDEGDGSQVRSSKYICTATCTSIIFVWRPHLNQLLEEKSEHI